MTQPTTPSILLGRVTIDVKDLDGNTVSVTIRAAKLSQISEYAKAQAGGPADLLAFATGLSIDTLDTLTPESIDRLLTAEEELNGPLAVRARRWEAKKLEAQLEQLRAAGVDVQQMMREVGLNSPEASPASSPPPA